jgi:hypothetical protein
MEIGIIDCEFSICKIEELSQITISDPFYFIAKTDEELSLVCKSSSVPENYIECDHDWRAFRIEGQLDFSLVGILSKISALLADNEISIFAISTFNTDYILVKKHNFEKAIACLDAEGYNVSKP